MFAKIYESKDGMQKLVTLGYDDDDWPCVTFQHETQCEDETVPAVVKITVSFDIYECGEERARIAFDSISALNYEQRLTELMNGSDHHQHQH